jgi:ATP-dependent helicase/nuclease subunit A
VLLGNSSISTLHSFCLNAIKENFHLIDGLDPNFRLLDSAEEALMKSDALELALEEKYAGPFDERFETLAESFGDSRDDRNMARIVLETHNFAQSHPWPDNWLSEMAEKAHIASEAEFDASIWNREILALCADGLDSLLETLLRNRDALLECCAKAADAQAAQNTIGRLKRLHGRLCERMADGRPDAPLGGHPPEASRQLPPTWREVRGAVAELGDMSELRPRARRGEDDERKMAREAVKSAVNTFRADVAEPFFRLDMPDIIKEFERLYALLSELKDVVIKFGKKYEAEKRKKAVLDFNDLEHLALEILTTKPDRAAKMPAAEPDRAADAPANAPNAEPDRAADAPANAPNASALPIASATVVPLLPTSTALAYRRKYAEVLIDEYQDSNLVQECIIKAVSGGDCKGGDSMGRGDCGAAQGFGGALRAAAGNTFMVGDVKQSIYRFRQAMPELFMGKYRAYQKCAGVTYAGSANTGAANADLAGIGAASTASAGTGVADIGAAGTGAANADFAGTGSADASPARAQPSPPEAAGAAREDGEGRCGAGGGDLAAGTKITLYRNFRSNPQILNFVNAVFSKIMSREAGDLDYTRDEWLLPGAPAESGAAAESAATASEGGAHIGWGGGRDDAVEVHLISKKRSADTDASAPANATANASANTAASAPANTTANADADVDAAADAADAADADAAGSAESELSATYEARLVAQRIAELVGTASVAGSAGARRPLAYGDIAILMRAVTGTAAIFADELARLGIPAYTESGAGYFEAYEVDIMMSALKIIDNPLQDIPMLAVLLSPIFSFSAEEAARIKWDASKGRDADADPSLYQCLKAVGGDPGAVGSPKARAVIRTLGEWRLAASEKPVSALIWHIMDSTDFYSHARAMPGGASRQANLRQLFEYARQYERISYKGIFNFIRFIDKMAEQGGDFASAKIVGENENTVRIMSIHKSKGLEFPVVFLCGCGRKFNMADVSKHILLHREMGFGPNYVDVERRISDYSIPKEIIARRIRKEAISEEMRILYVALTRAKEKLILTGTLQDAKRFADGISRMLEPYSERDESDAASREKAIRPDHSLGAGNYLYWILAALELRSMERGQRQYAGHGDYADTLDSDIARVLIRHIGEFGAACAPAAAGAKAAVGTQGGAAAARDSVLGAAGTAGIQNDMQDADGNAAGAKAAVGTQGGAAAARDGVLGAAGTAGIQNDVQDTDGNAADAQATSHAAAADAPIAAVTRAGSEAAELRAIERRLSWTYPHRALASIPRKVSVTEISEGFPAARHTMEAQDLPERSGAAGFFEREGGRERVSLAVPAFISGARGFSKAQIGTFTHLVLEKADFKAVFGKADIDRTISELVAKGILPQEQADAVDRAALLRFFESDAGKLARSAEKLHRETTFTIKLSLAEYFSLFDPDTGSADAAAAGASASAPAPSPSPAGIAASADATMCAVTASTAAAPAPSPSPSGIAASATSATSAMPASAALAPASTAPAAPAASAASAAVSAIASADDYVLLQGSIDCWFESEDGLILIDYKTGYFAEADIAADAKNSKYRRQIALYALALKKITGHEATRRYIFLLSSGKCVQA